jgi:translation elongation factor EF-1alpha
MPLIIAASPTTTVTHGKRDSQSATLRFAIVWMEHLVEVIYATKMTHHTSVHWSRTSEQRSTQRQTSKKIQKKPRNKLSHISKNPN